jgi:hypothetical protein
MQQNISQKHQFYYHFWQIGLIWWNVLSKQTFGKMAKHFFGNMSSMKWVSAKQILVKCTIIYTVTYNLIK